MYFACYAEYANNITFVHALKLSDNSKVTFSSGVNYTLYEGDTSNVGAKTDSGANRMGQIAVSGNYLLIPYPGLNKISVYNKTTMAFVRDLVFPEAKHVSSDSSNVWIVSGTNTIAKYSVASDGTISPLGVTITNTIDPGQVNVGPNQLAIIDYSTQQVRFYSGNASYIGVKGIEEGYSNTAQVDNERFYFKDPQFGKMIAGVAFQSDGSFWIVDPGNERIQKFNNQYQYQSSLYIPGSNYFSNVDSGNAGRVFRGFLEYSIDYNAPLTGSSGWQLVSNWGGSVNPANYDLFRPLVFVKSVNKNSVTKTLGGLVTSNFKLELIELTPDRQVRYTGIIKEASFIDDNDNLIEGNTAYPITGFDVSGNPIFGAGQLLSDTSSLMPTTPLNSRHERNCITSDDKIAYYNTAGEQQNGPHIGIMDKGGNSWTALTGYETYPSYLGSFPIPDYFDIGNYVNHHAGTMIQAVKNLFFASYHGENWRQKQINKFNVYHSSGLSVAQFGITKAELIGYNQPMEAGNALSPQFILLSSDVAYMYHGDESDFGSLHRWKISGLNSVSFISLPLKIAPPPGGIVNLNAGLVFGTTLVRNPNKFFGDADIDESGNVFKADIGLTSPSKSDPDLVMFYSNANAIPRTISRHLQLTPIELSSWSLSGIVNYIGTDAYGGKQNIEILDNNGKVIANLYFTVNSSGLYSVGANDKTFTSAYGSDIKVVIEFNKEFSFTRSGNNLVLTYAGITKTTSVLVDSDAEISKPTTLRFYFISTDGNAGRGRRIAVSDMKWQPF